MTSDDPLVYDLYCGHGGVGLALGELDVAFVGVDVEDRSESYPGAFVRADASRPPLASGADLVWASPPCLAYTPLSAVNASRYDWDETPRERYPTIPELRVREIAESLGSEYVIENVAQCEDLRDPARLHGGAFGYPFRMERRFETSFPVPDATSSTPPTVTYQGPSAGDTVSHTPDLAAAKGVPDDWPEQAINSAIPREYVHWVLSFCPTLDVPRPEREQTLLAEVAG